MEGRKRQGGKWRYPEHKGGECSLAMERPMSLQPAGKGGLQCSAIEELILPITCRRFSSRFLHGCKEEQGRPWLWNREISWNYWAFDIEVSYKLSQKKTSLMKSESSAGLRAKNKDLEDNWMCLSSKTVELSSLWPLACLDHFDIGQH